MTEPYPQPDPARPSGSQPSWYGGGTPASASGHGSSSEGWRDGSAAQDAPSYSEAGWGPSAPYGQGVPRGGTPDPSAPGQPVHGQTPAAPGEPVYAAPGAPVQGQGIPFPGYAGQPLAPGQSAGTGLSIASLILGILSIVGGFSLLLPPIVGVVLGHMGRRREPNGQGMALAGLIMNYLALAFILLMVLAVILMVVMGLSLDAVYNGGTPGLDT